jgi:serine/threonine-protein kinase
MGASGAHAAHGCGGRMMIGRTLSHFKIVDKLGEGGMGEVWLAEDQRLGRKVALKILPPARAESEDRLRRFEDEARAASALNHPGIAHIYDVGEADGIHFIAMEHVDGESLDQRIAGSAMTTTEILDIGSRLADALAAAHGQGVTHRDIKPPNLMLTGGGRLKVLDFGLAKLRPALGEGGGEATTQTITQPGVVMGTVQYMSPEQALGKDADHRSDIFSTGVVLYQMATGRLPFKGSTPTETITEIVRSEPQPVSELSPVTPPELDRIIRKCMEKDPARRYQSARELVVDLSNLKRDTESGVTATVATRKSPSRSAFIGVAVAAALMVAVGFLLIRSDLWLSGRDSIESIAVLPFENGTGDQESDYLCDGLTESLINTLSQIPELKVISRRSVFAFKDSADDPATIGRKLEVQALVMGRLAQRGDRLTVSAELVDVSDNHQLWGGRFNREQSDVLAIEEDLATTIARTLKLELTPETKDRLERRFAVDPEAHRLFLQSRQFIVGSRREMEKGVEYLQKAIEIDPDYALAHAWLGYAYMVQAYHSVIGRDEALHLGKAALDRAVEIEPELAEAYAVAGNIACFFDWDWERAEREFRRAIEADPKSVMARLSYADFLTAMARWDESIEHSRVAKELDPLSSSPAHWLAIGYLGQHEYDLAIAEFRETLDLNPNWTWGYIKLTKAYADAGRCEEAMATAKDAEAQLHGGSTPLARSWLGYSYAVCGDAERTESALRELEAYDAEHDMDPGVYANVYAGLGDVTRVLDYLEEGIQIRSPDAPYLPILPKMFIEELANEPRYLALMEHMDFGPQLKPKGRP